MLEAVPWENPTYGILGGAAGNVAYGGTVNPPRNRKGGAGNPPPKGARASALPDIALQARDDDAEAMRDMARFARRVRRRLGADAGGVRAPHRRPARDDSQLGAGQARADGCGQGLAQDSRQGARDGPACAHLRHGTAGAATKSFGHAVAERAPACGGSTLATNLRSGKAPFAGAASALAYLVRYTHKTAIANHRMSTSTASRCASGGATTPVATEARLPGSSSGHTLWRSCASNRDGRERQACRGRAVWPGLR